MCLAYPCPRARRGLGQGRGGQDHGPAVLSRTLARHGRQVIALDCDSDPNLAANCGLPDDEVAALRPFLDQSGPRRIVPTARDPQRLLADYGRRGPDD